MKILVYILPTHTPSTSDHLYYLFERSKLFKIVEPDCTRGTIGDSVTEANQVIYALENSYQYHPYCYTIVIKDTSVTNSTLHEITKLVLLAIMLQMVY